MKRNPKIYIDDILESIEKINEYTANFKGEKDLFSNNQAQDAVIRRLIVIGEATRQIPYYKRSKYKDIPWRKIIGLRNIAVHEYFRLNLKRVWKTIKDDLPEFQKQISEVLRDLP